MINMINAFCDSYYTSQYANSLTSSMQPFILVNVTVCQLSSLS